VFVSLFRGEQESGKGKGTYIAAIGEGVVKCGPSSAV
jgi:hypothetical protein